MHRIVGVGEHETTNDLGPAIRRACSAVAAAADHVRIDDAAIARLARSFDGVAPEPFPEERFRGDDETVARSVLAWNAVNFGSGWFPHLRKHHGLSGARTLARHWQHHVRDRGVPTATWLADVDRGTVADLFHQDYRGPVVGLIDAFTDAWRELGTFLADAHDGSATSLIASAGGSAQALAVTLGQLPRWRDEHPYHGMAVPLYKRAQITAAQLRRELGPSSIADFGDLDQLTAFADNLVPHTLKMLGVLVLDDATNARIESGAEFRPGEPAEVEIRACGVEAVERLVVALGAAGIETTAADLDQALWQRGQSAKIKARPRHRCRCTFY